MRNTGAIWKRGDTPGSHELEGFVSNLPFEPTQAQSFVSGEKKTVERPDPMPGWPKQHEVRPKSDAGRGVTLLQ